MRHLYPLLPLLSALLLPGRSHAQLSGADSLRQRVGQLPPGFYVLHVVQQGVVVSRQSLQLAR